MKLKAIKYKVFTSFRIVLLAFFLAIVVSCASTKVHLFTNGSTEVEIEELEKALSDAGYESVRNSLPIPEGVVAPTIIYSPLHRDLQQVERLRDFLAVRGFGFNLEPISQGNHFYTGINVGLYPKEYIPGPSQEYSIIDIEFSGECPEVDATLVLRKDLTYEVEIFGWDKVKNIEEGRLIKGTWQQADQAVYLVYKGKQVQFGLSRFESKSEYAKIEGTRLTDIEQSEYFEHCEFVFLELSPW